MLKDLELNDGLSVMVDTGTLFKDVPEAAELDREKALAILRLLSYPDVVFPSTWQKALEFAPVVDAILLRAVVDPPLTVEETEESMAVGDIPFEGKVEIFKSLLTLENIRFLER